MAVPVYTPNQSLRPALQTGISANASPADFGAAVGAGLKGLGQGAGEVGRAAEQLAMLENEAAAKDADNAYADWMRNRLYGDGGYMTQAGRSAIEGMSSFQKDAEEQRREIGKGLSPGAARAYERVSNARKTQALNSAIVHSSNERKRWVAESVGARVSTFANDALDGYQNPALVNRSIAAAQQELRDHAGLFGWSPEVLREKETVLISEVHKGVANRIAELDPVAARKYANDHKKDLTAADKAGLEKRFAPLVIDERGKRKAAEYFSKKSGWQEFASTDLPPAARGLGDAIAGVESGGRYDVRFDGSKTGVKIREFGRHPGISERIPEGFQEAGNVSSAAGRYQFVSGTWERAAAALGLTDFSPESQDRAMWWLASEDYRTRTGRDIESDLAAGQFGRVRQGLAGTWEGLGKLTDEQFAQRFQGGVGGNAVGASADDFLDGISNPEVREAARRRISAGTKAQAEQQKAQTEYLKTQAFSFVDRGGSPDSLPADLRSQIGRVEMAGLWSYYEARQNPGGPKTDDETLYALQTEYATDPDAFAQKDLFAHRDKLSDADWTKVNGWRQSALEGSRESREAQINLKSAFSLAEDQLAAVGITTVGKSGSARTDAAKEIAAFQMSLSHQMERFKEQNGREPTQVEIQDMTSTLLLPVVLRGVNRSILGISLYTSGEDGFMFQARDHIAETQADAMVAFDVEYDNIPVTERAGIEAQLRAAGMDVSDDAVVDIYKGFLIDKSGLGK